jgi:hypothetical protein
MQAMKLIFGIQPNHKQNRSNMKKQIRVTYTKAKSILQLNQAEHMLSCAEFYQSKRPARADHNLRVSQLVASQIYSENKPKN